MKTPSRQPNETLRQHGAGLDPVSSYVIFRTTPCDVAVASKEIARFGNLGDSSTNRLVQLSAILGVRARCDEENRVLHLTASPTLWLMVPREMVVVGVPDDALLAVPTVFRHLGYEALLIEDDQPRALVVDLVQLQRRAERYLAQSPRDATVQLDNFTDSV